MPDSRPAGVGFDSYSEYMRRVEQANTPANTAAQPMQSVQGPVQNPVLPFPPAAGAYPATATGAPTASELAQAGIGAPGVTAPLPSDVPPANPQVDLSANAYYPPGTTPPAPEINNVGISDEQDFQAVSARETIASDKERIAQNRAAYQQVQPTELPERTDEAEAAVDLVQYALSAPNRLGEMIYPRSKVALTNSEKACARYNTPEAAQQAFLHAGGPRRDPKNLDPDGDGFACYWDPTPFQAAKQ